MLNTIKTIAGTVGSSIFNEWQNQRAEEYADRARKKNYLANESAADNANQRWRNNYEEYYTPQAQVRMLRDAGLSPSIALSGGLTGGGGSSASPQGGIGGGLQSNYFPTSAIDAAQIANINANTEKTKAETKKTESETTAQDLENYITQKTTDETVEQAKQTTAILAAQLQKTIAETSNIKWDTDFKTITQNEQWQQLKNKNTLILEQILSEQTNRKLTDREREHYDTIFDKWQIEVYQKFLELDIKDWEVEYQNRWFESQAMYLENQINLGRDRLSFDKDYFEFDKIKWQQQRNLERWRIGTQTVTDIAKIFVFGTAAFMGGGQGAITGGLISIPNSSGVKFQ